MNIYSSIFFVVWPRLFLGIWVHCWEFCAFFLRNPTYNALLPVTDVIGLSRFEKRQFTLGKCELWIEVEEHGHLAI